MDDGEAIQQQLRKRYDQALPPLWWQLQQRGCYDPHSEAHLQLSDLRWLTPAQILEHRFPDDQVPGLMPFAHTAAEDSWCWYRPWQYQDAVPVAFCPNEDEVAYAYAPDFTGFIFRAVLEEYACTCLTEYHSPGRSLAILGDYASTVGDLLPEHYAAILRQVAERPLLELEHGYFGTLTGDEAQDIITTTFANWPHFDREFAQFTGN